MKPRDHHLLAEQLLLTADETASHIGTDRSMLLVAMAQVHATLAMSEPDV